MSFQFDNKDLNNIRSELGYCFEKSRRATFSSWVFKDDAKCSAPKLAEAGFVFVGNRHDPDSVKCFLCDKHLDCWEEDDDPWAEHLKHSPNCTFAKMEKPENTFTLSEHLDIRNELIMNIIKRTVKKKREAFDQALADVIDNLKTLK